MKKTLLAFIFAVVSAAVMWAAEPTVVLSEDFAAFTEGSESEPGTTDISSYSSGKLKTNLPGWSGKYVYEAGGMLKIADGGNLKTARLNLSAQAGVVRITARVRSLSDYGGIFKFSIGYSTAKQVIASDDSWHTVQFVAAGGTSSSQITVEPVVIADGMLIDNIVVETSPEFFPAPEALQPSVANGTMFLASWKRVTGATSYLLDVYTKGEGEAKNYVLHDESVSKNSKTISDLNADSTYYFTVRATNGTATSDYSNEVRVVKVIQSLEAPVATAATNVTATSFTANWNASAEAQDYQLTVYKRTKIAEAGSINLLDEDFDGITKGSIDKVEFGPLSEYLDAYTHQPGWYAENHAYAGGKLALSPFGSEASLTTPYCDFSNDGGKLTVTINMAAGTFGQFTDGDSVAVKLIDADGKALETDSIALAPDGFKDYVVNFSNGAANQAIELTYKGSNKVFIDQFTVAQNVAAGYIKNEVLASYRTSATSHDVTVPDAMNATVGYGYTVQAIAETVNTFAEIDSIYSSESNLIVVENAGSGVNGNLAATAKVSAHKGVITVVSPVAAVVEVLSLNGSNLATASGSAGVFTIDVATRGVVIVKVNGKATKLIL